MLTPEGQQIAWDTWKIDLHYFPESNMAQLIAPFFRRSLVDCVIVWKYDRFARSLSVLISALQQFSALGVDFISYTQNIDTTTPMGRLFYHVIGSFAEFEREMIVERVRAGLRNARAKGKVLGRPERDCTARSRTSRYEPRA
jgi:DNA invertase Pin-like site-specific DNA recombinase